MARGSHIRKSLRVGVVALLGTGLLAAGLAGGIHSIAGPAAAHAAALTTADATSTTADTNATPIATSSDQDSATPEATDIPDQGDVSDGATETPDQGDVSTEATDVPEANSTPEATDVPEANSTPEATAVPGTGDNGGDQARGSGDQGGSDEGAVHDGQFGQSHESDAQLAQEEADHVAGGADDFTNVTTATQNGQPEADR